MESHWELKHHSESVMQRVVDEVMDHHEDCPLNAGGIYVAQRGTVWHKDEDCQFLRQATVRRLPPCSGCAMRVQTPYKANVNGTTLEEEINGWFTHASLV